MHLSSFDKCVYRAKKLCTVIHSCRGKEKVWKFAWKYEARLIKTTSEVNSMDIFALFCQRLILSISILSIYVTYERNT